MIIWYVANKKKIIAKVKNVRASPDGIGARKKLQSSTRVAELPKVSTCATTELSELKHAAMFVIATNSKIPVTKIILFCAAARQIQSRHKGRGISRHWGAVSPTKCALS